MPGLHSDSRFRLCKDSISCRSVSKTGGLQLYCPELELSVIATLSERLAGRKCIGSVCLDYWHHHSALPPAET